MSRWLSIMMILLVAAMLSGCGEEPAYGPGNTQPQSSATEPGTTATATVDITPSPTPTSAADTASAGPTITPEPSVSPTRSPAPTGGSNALEIEPVIGKADVSEFLTLRGAASSTGSSVAQIPKDAEFTVLMVETGKKWLKVKYDGKEGFVQAKYVSVGSSDADRVCTVFCDSALNVRRGAGVKYDIIGAVDYGTSLIVKSKTTVSGSTWYKVEIGDLTGYISAKSCRISEN